MAENRKTMPLARMGDGRPDYVLMLIVVALLIIGLMMVYSSSFPLAYGLYGESTYFLVRQGVWVSMGLVIMALVMRIEYHRWQRLSIVLMLLTLALLVAVLLFGEEVNGSKQFLWGASIQPSEVCKVTTVLYIAHWLSSKGEKLRQATYGLIPFAILIGTISGLIILEPDFGTAILMIATAAGMFFIAGADLLQLVLSSVVAGSTFLLLVANSEYAWRRVGTFLQDPFTSPLGRDTYQIITTLVALGTGGISGAGLGSGQQKLLFLPAAHTDAVFAVLGEELGLIGCLTVVSLFAALAYRGFRIASQAQDTFGFILASGITIWLTVQALVNIAVVTASLPFTGLPLPFISYGGSSLVISMMGVGVLLSLSRGTREKTEADNAAYGFWGRHGRARLSDSGRREAAGT
jgi:cell division protein FtsW